VDNFQSAQLLRVIYLWIINFIIFCILAKYSAERCEQVLSVCCAGDMFLCVVEVSYRSAVNHTGYTLTSLATLTWYLL